MTFCVVPTTTFFVSTFTLGTSPPCVVTVGVRNRYDETLATDYTITVQKAGAVTVRLLDGSANTVMQKLGAIPAVDRCSVLSDTPPAVRA